jgi:YHS domain-containing protein
MTFTGAALTALTLISAGCATSSSSSAGNAAGQAESTATCHVCRYNNDLACICVKVKDNTPVTQYHGTNYYFCSEDCRAAFLKRPGKYLPEDKNARQ